ncbi:hypothetical protein B4900_03140 [Yersinia rohdei]|nr:hypothetical protein B4900_03140 [Yersinia rohdei]
MASINVSNNAVITTERDFILQILSLNVGQDLQVSTGGDWLLSTVQTRDQITANYSGGSSNSEHIRHLGSEVNVGGVLTANVSDLTAVGANINANTIDIQAQNISLSAATDSLQVTGESSSKRHTSSVNLYDAMLCGSQLNANIVGSNSTKVTDTGKSITNIGSTVGSVLGNVNMTAGEDLTVKGSEVLAGKDINLTGKNVAILAAENQSSQTHTVEQKQSGLTLALSGTVGSAVNTAVTTAKEAREESNGRLAALQGVKAALSGVQAVQGGQLAAVNASDQNAIGVSLSYGSQSSKSEQTVNQTPHQGSTLTAGNNLNITATGNGVKGADGDIVVQGGQ